jgi:hypothetical protein
MFLLHSQTVKAALVGLVGTALLAGMLGCRQDRRPSNQEVMEAVGEFRRKEAERKALRQRLEETDRQRATAQRLARSVEELRKLRWQYQAERQRAAKEKEALARVQKLGGKIVRDTKDPLRPVIEVDLSNTPTFDQDLALLAGLPQLRTLILHHTAVTEAGLRHLHSLTGLHTLDLRGIQVSAAARKALRRALPDLKELRYRPPSTNPFVQAWE